MKKVVAAVCIAGALTACQTTEPYTVRNSFIVKDFSWIKEDGAAVLKGQAFLRTVGGDVKTCAGSEVVLVPYNTYTLEIHNAFKQHPMRPVHRDPRYNEYRRVTMCDASGSFSFKGLPSGTYFVGVTVSWGAPTRWGISQQGGNLRRTIILNPEEVQEIILTEKDM